MAKFTKLQRREIESALSQLNRGIKFILDADISVCRRSKRGTTTLDFTRNPPPDCLLSNEQRAYGPYALTEITKDIGSDLTGLYTAKANLIRLLEGN